MRFGELTLYDIGMRRWRNEQLHFAAEKKNLQISRNYPFSFGINHLLILTNRQLSLHKEDCLGVMSNVYFCFLLCKKKWKF